VELVVVAQALVVLVPHRLLLAHLFFTQEVVAADHLMLVLVLVAAEQVVAEQVELLVKQIRAVAVAVTLILVVLEL
jgi:hypothetical protein